MAWSSHSEIWLESRLSDERLPRRAGHVAARALLLLRVDTVEVELAMRAPEGARKS